MPIAIIPWIFGGLAGVAAGSFIGAKAASPTVVGNTQQNQTTALIMQLAVTVIAGVIVYKVTK